jgi:hypothetical protein
MHACPLASHNEGCLTALNDHDVFLDLVELDDPALFAVRYGEDITAIIVFVADALRRRAFGPDRYSRGQGLLLSISDGRDDAEQSHG